MSERIAFNTGYMDDALFDLAKVIERAERDLADVAFDTLVGTGFSGGVVIPALALAMDKQFVLIRKDTDDSHHGRGRLIGQLGKRWLFVDDFVGSGSTRKRVMEKINEAATHRVNFMYEPDPHKTTFVGTYQYVASAQGRDSFQPAEETPS